jgi:hypothetical protein
MTRNSDPFDFLSDLALPRPMVWQSFVKARRYFYSFGAIGLLAVCIGLPLLLFIGEGREAQPSPLDHVRPGQVALYFGALVVVAFIRYAYVLFKLWDNSKWLAQYGSIAEANLLWVIRGENRLIVTYRFWTPTGVEVRKETVIDADGPIPLADLCAGDVVPVLYDLRGPKSRGMLWAEIERYVTLRESPRARSPHIGQRAAESRVDPVTSTAAARR